MGLRRTVDAERSSASAEDALLADVPSGFRSARGEEAHDVRHVAAAHEQPAAVSPIANEGRNPPDGFGLDFGGRRREHERPDIRVNGRGEELAENADGRRSRSDVSVKPRMTVEQRM